MLTAMSTAPEVVRPGSSAGLVTSLRQRLVRQFQVQVADWLDTCRELAGWEDRYLVESSAADRLAEHAAMLDEMERVGQWLATAASQLGFDANVTTEQIQSTLQDLRDSRAMWHGDVPAPRKQEILRDCFNES